MRTLIEFQNEVLTPLREERDKKMAATYAKEHDVKKTYMDIKNQYSLEQIAFERQQKKELDDFTAEQERKFREFCIKAKAAKGKAYDAWYQGCCEVKIQRRSIHETYQNQFALAISEYNKERVAAGTPPLVFHYPGQTLEEVSQESNGDNKGE